MMYGFSVKLKTKITIMKIKNILLAGTLLVSVLASAQKDELKTLKKIYTKDKPSASDVTDYKSAIAKLQG